MTQEIEIEYKNLLTKSEFEHIMHHYPVPEQGIRQTNYYFETQDFLLRKHGCALRIREKSEKYVLTLKEPHPDGLLETHDLLSKHEAEKWLSGEKIYKENVYARLKEKQIPPEQLKCFGSLVTERRETAYKNIQLVLDYSMYNDTADYELEIEAPSIQSGSDFFNSFLAENNIRVRHTPNKIERFFYSLSEEN